MRRRRADSGAVIVEAAFAIPIFLLFVTGLVDLGMWTVNSNQATNAARDGARSGILAFETADAISSPDRDVIVAAALAHLPSGTADPDDVAIRCVDPEGAEIACAGAQIDVDRIRVEVDWAWPLVTPVAGIIGTSEGAVKGSATMLIVGRPARAPAPSATTTTTPGCSVRDLAVSPATVTAKNGGSLSDDLTISFRTDDPTTCGDLVVQLDAPGDGAADHSCGCGAGPAHTWTYDKNSHSFWQPGTATVRVLDGSSIVAATDFTVQ